MSTMSRKLKRKSQKDDICEKNETKKKKIKRYKKQKCAFVDKNGKRCRYNAVGKSTLCKKHGGNPIIKENLIKDKELENIPLSALSTKFKPDEHPIMFIEYSRMGMSEVEIAAEFNVSVSTLKSWAEKFDMFNRAYEIGQAMHEAWWIEQGKAGLHAGRNFNTSLFKFLTGNKLGYSDKIETKSLNMNVHGVLMVPDKVSEEEWEQDDVIDVEIDEG